MCVFYVQYVQYDYLILDILIQYMLFRRLCCQTKWGLMEDIRVAKSTDILFAVGNVFSLIPNMRY